MTSKPILLPILAVAALLGVTTLGGCSRSDNEPAPVESRDEPAPLPVETPREDVPVEASPTPTPTPANVSEAVPPEEAPAPDAQMLDDATATGMTARATRDQAPADEAVPAEQVEKK